MGIVKLESYFCSLNPYTENYCSRIPSQELPHILTSLGRDLAKKVKDLVEENDVPRKSFFTLGPPPNSYENLR